MRQAQPILMEPIMKVSVIVPDEYTGTVIGDLSSRRGQIQGQEARNRYCSGRCSGFRCLKCLATPAICVLIHRVVWSVFYGAA